jgi:hypothetical protein
MRTGKVDEAHQGCQKNLNSGPGVALQITAFGTMLAFN